MVAGGVGSAAEDKSGLDLAMFMTGSDDPWWRKHKAAPAAKLLRIRFHVC